MRFMLLSYKPEEESIQLRFSNIDLSLEGEKAVENDKLREKRLGDK